MGKLTGKILRNVLWTVWDSDDTSCSRTLRLSGWADGALRVYDLATWSLEHTLTAHSGPILSVARVGDKVITTGADMTASEWDPATWTLSRVLRDHYGAVCSVTALDDGRVLTASLDGKLKVWEAHKAPKSVRAPPAAAEAAGGDRFL